ncbi:MAG: HAMP domain-containing histidine kinase [Acidobacteriota bacterium]|nr:HAMP domain-containing histidine kinase [Acidobacteriota bacterium]
MASKCFMCGAAITRGILCERCDKPRRPKQPAPAKPAADVAAAGIGPPPAAPITTKPAAEGGGPTRRSAQAAIATATAPATEPEPFPKAPLLPFPVESASPAITSLANVIMAAGAPAIVLSADRGVKFITEEAKRLFGVPQSDLATVKQIEGLSGARIGELSVPASTALHIRNHNILYSLVPISGGAMGAVLIFREADPMNAAHASLVAFVRETIFTPLRSLRESVLASSRTRQGDPLLQDWAATIDQILSSLEMAPEVKEPASPARTPKVVDILHSLADRFRPFADLKNVQLQIDVPELEDRFRNHEQLVDALSVLMDNSLHYVPTGGQIVAGVRWMEHKGKPLLLFFVMDNGPVVPEALRSVIFEPGFAWNPQGSVRTGGSLFKVREFAVAHAGSVWVESKTGKACTFFLRVRPDGAR